MTSNLLPHAFLWAALPAQLLVSALPAHHNSNGAITNHTFHGNTTDVDVVAAELDPLLELLDNHRGDDELFKRADEESSSNIPETGRPDESTSYYVTGTGDLSQTPSNGGEQFNAVNVDTSIARGNAMLSLLRDDPITPHELRHSRFNNFADLERHGWSWNDRPAHQEDGKLQSAMAKLNIGAFYGIDDVEAKHNTQTMIAEMEYAATGAVYRNYYDFRKHAIVSTIYNSPDSASGFGKQYQNLLPPLQDWSDVTFLTLQRFSQGPYPTALNSVNEIVFAGVSDAPTISVLDFVLEEIEKGWRSREAIAYPGAKFRAGSADEVERDSFVAILGTPVGMSVAKLLGQHRDRSGLFRITSIDVFCNGCDPACPDPYVVFHLQDTPETGAGRTVVRRSGAVRSGGVDDANVTDEFLDSQRGDNKVAKRREVPSWESPGHPDPHYAVSIHNAFDRGNDRSRTESFSSNGSSGVSSDDDYDNVSRTDASHGLSDDAQADLPPDKAAQEQSRWTDSNDLAKYGWVVFEAPQDEVEEDFAWEGMGEIETDFEKPKLEGYISEHQHEVEVDGVKYPYTFGLYNNYYNLNRGVIIMVQAETPQETGPDLEPPVNGPYPPLSDWSDLTYLTFQIITRPNPNSRKNLRVLVFALISDDSFHAVFEQIMCASDMDSDGNSWDDRLGFEYGSVEHTALMGTPPGIAAANFLGQHKQQLGWLGVARVEVFRDAASGPDDEPQGYMVMHLEHGSKLQPGKGSILGEDLAEEPESTGSSHDTAMQIRSSSSEEEPSLEGWAFQQGARQELAGRDVDGTAPATTFNEAIYLKWGWTMTDQECDVADPDDAIQSIVDRYPEHGKLQSQTWTHTNDVEVEGVEYKATNGEYDNSYSPGVIITNDNMSPHEMAPKQRPPVTGPLPKLQHWSQVAAILYMDFFRTTELQAVVRRVITEERSRAVIKQIVQTSSAKIETQKVRLPGQLSFLPGQEPYYALLGIPHGKSVAYLLAQQRDILGDKCVKEIHLWWRLTSPYLWYEIGQAPCGAALAGSSKQTSSSKHTPKVPDQPDLSLAKPQLTAENAIGSFTQPQRPSLVRHGYAKRADNGQSTNEEDAILSRFRQAGEAYSYELNSVHYHFSQPSRFRAGQLEAATARSGWCFQGEPQSTPFCNPPLGPALAMMDIQNGGPLAIRTWQFDPDPDDGDAQVAVVSGLYARGLVVAVETVSPSNVMRDGARPPELQFWSDIAFIQYTQLYPQNRLKNVVRMAVVEDDTALVVEAIRQSRRLSDDRSNAMNYPQTPNAIVLYWGQRDSNATLGTAGGKGVANMLLQHRDDLGHRCVQEIRIWYGPDKDSSHIWFRIKSAPCGPSPQESRRSKRSEGVTLSDIESAGASDAAPPTVNDEQKALDTLSAKGGGWALDLDDTNPDLWCNAVFKAASNFVPSGRALNFIYKQQQEHIAVRKITWKHDRQVTSSTGPLQPTMAEYSNAYLPGTIIGLSNESPKQRGISSGIDVNNADNIPALQFWSDITFLQYMSMFPMRPLQAIIQQNVYNLETKEAVDAIRHIDYNLRDEPILTDYPQFPGLQLDYGSKAFFALLAVPVGRSIALMLSTHRDELRPLCVWEIRVWWDTGMENTTIWYRIKVTPCGPPRGPAGPAKRSNNDLQSDPGRLGKRVDPAYISAPSTPEDDMKLLTTLSKAGGAWAVALDSNDPKYWEHGVYQYGQLQEKTAKWGWTLESSMQSSAAAMLPATVPVFKDIYGKDLSKISMWAYLESWGQAWQKIVAQNIKSPASSGPKQNPPNHGPYPPLEHWSDLTFLQYSDLFCNDPLQNVIQLEVYNKQAKQVVNAIRHTIFDLNDDTTNPANYPAFPGLTIVFNTKAYNALLAIPNGKGIAQLLSQNRATLGHKCVEEIRFWYDFDITHDTPTMWYKVKDAPCGSPGAELANDPEKLAQATQEEFEMGLLETT
ncbi:hypothetical protein CLAFUR4_14551 [Fulvia fulva]|nr:hypothetical protein CLAFUR4_14551 [Fulvia fulva]KAK4609674.1 hypothetical protein CLAFUR0_14551 [Fulvia fulva]WPV37802.1 hypothetical protein CLAFUW7_14560 [Fulvia fulva]